ncbi:MAG: DUF1385 domain-containing protein [Bacteroides sp.]|nr:DUF1385 domain-containing protein [Eubacterium sp.]MCM1417497.1 DUF1385 domain-containing protein [Roseburia sp.]MCM1462917.1 DUF1385 domain-containing protein [Bacteroides sp.]
MPKNKNETKGKKTTIGGQALIEGIMMKGPSKAAMAVRLPDGSLTVEVKELKKKKWYNKAPFIRGTINFVSQLLDGYHYISRSAELSGVADEEEDEEPSKFERWLTDKFGERLMPVLMAISMILGVALAVVLFVFVPTWLFMLIQLAAGETDLSAFQSLFEGVLKIAVFVGYMWIVSNMKDMKRMYGYHGAEHKTIACYEAKKPLTVENIRPMRRFHPRCGTSFIFLVLIISILVYSVVPITNAFFVEAFGATEAVAMLLRVVCKLLLLPVIVGISYEVIRLAGRYDNIVTRIVSAPGLALQRLTTNEPDDSMIEAAIAAMNPVIPEDGESDEW